MERAACAFAHSHGTRQDRCVQETVSRQVVGAEHRTRKNRCIGDRIIAELTFKRLEFACYLTDISESWKVCDQVMGILGQTGFVFFLRSVSKQKVSR